VSRILKRPMFRRGGSTNTGIMSGLVNRTKLEDGTKMIGSMTEDQFKSNLEALMGLQDQFAPVSKTRLPLGEVGLALASGAPLVDALGAGYKKFVSEDDKRRALLDKRKSAAVSTVLSQALKKEKDTRTEAVKNAVAQGLVPGSKEFNDYIRSVTVKSESQTAAIKNALAQGLVPGTKQFNDYIAAATIKGAGLQIKFDAEGRPIITQGNVPEDKEKETKANEILNTTFKLNNAGTSLVNELKDAKVGAVGTIINALDSAGAQVSQAAQAFGIGQKSNLDLSGGTEKIDNYLEEKFGSALANDAIKFAKIKSVSIQLAYLLAKADEPGGRFTDRDIALKMEELGLGANPQKTIEVLTNSINLRNENLNFEYKNLMKKDIDFSDINAIGSFALGLKESETEKKSGKSDQTKEDMPVFSFDAQGNPLILKDGKFVPYKDN
tara:strand:+ start:202 stop:1515 length:1314 start_codon:yes stop_codon:yes gene_type:complete